MKQKNLRRKFSRTISQWVYLNFKKLKENQKILAADMRYQIDKEFGVLLSHANIVSCGNRVFKKLAAEGKSIRHIWGQSEHGNKELLGWEYGVVGEINKAKNTGGLIGEVRVTAGWIKRVQLLSQGALQDHALTEEGRGLANVLIGTNAVHLIDQTDKAIEKIILLPSETKK